jgi:hypothetical protein
MKLLVCLGFIATMNMNVLAQSGGPPMLTDDPGTVELHGLEINLSVNPHIQDRSDWEAPLIDVNYGLLEGVQLKVEWPLVFAETEGGRVVGRAGDPSVGMKWRLLDEERSFFSVSIYPAVSLPVRAGDPAEVKLPVELERSIGMFVVGEEMGFLYQSPHGESLLNGTLLGASPVDKLQIMMEFYLQKDLHAGNTTEGYVNIGMRYDLSPSLGVMTSAGTECITPEEEDRERFFSFLGVQLRL